MAGEVVVGECVAYECECEGPHRVYRVTGHNGSVVVCSYCEDCASLAARDWNGETAAIEAVAS